MVCVLEIKEEIKKAVIEALQNAKNAGKLDYSEIPDFVIEVPRDKSHGDYATNIAMLLASQTKMPPKEIAAVLEEHFELGGTHIESIHTAGPGFLNFILEKDWLYGVIIRACEEDDKYGCSSIGQGEEVQVEFVSANPTGLLHMGNARGAALGDTIASLLQAVGYNVIREFYINDAGKQVEIFGRSLEVRYLQKLGEDVQLPEDGYHGRDIIDTVNNFISKYGEKHLGSSEKIRLEALVQFALQEKLENIKNSLELIRVKFDVWFSEQELHDNKEIEEAIDILINRGFVYEKENALWFNLSSLGDYKDEVLVRSNGVPTYFAADIAYHKNKFERGFKHVINIWGADHHGHVARMKFALKALGFAPERLDIIIMQLVRLFQSGEMVRMSKRTGTYITLQELVDEVGIDAVRYFFIMRSADSHLDFDLDLAKSQTQDNPVFYVQYAHARICSIFRQVEDLRIPLPDYNEVNLKLLKDSSELDLMEMIAQYPAVIDGAAKALEPHRLTKYAHELAGLFHKFYTDCRVISDNEELMKARLILVDAAKITLRNVLNIMGVSAPERM